MRESDPREVVITRLYDAPRELVFRAWTEPARMAAWWGPHGFTNPVCEMDVRRGGAYRIDMRGSDGIVHPCIGQFGEITPPERLMMVMNHSELPEEWHDMMNPQRDKSLGRPALESHITVTFETVTLAGQGSQTLLTIRVRFDSPTIRERFLNMGMFEGWSESLERLASLLARG
ncbi:MAG: SRPBCC domain-containing protein [Planctomycetes bacterium]|nr:SRPBCC domain-containing protein [Planctomycetota bacterium]